MFQIPVHSDLLPDGSILIARLRGLPERPISLNADSYPLLAEIETMLGDLPRWAPAVTAS